MTPIALASTLATALIVVVVHAENVRFTADLTVFKPLPLWPAESTLPRFSRVQSPNSGPRIIARRPNACPHGIIPVEEPGSLGIAAARIWGAMSRLYRDRWGKVISLARLSLDVPPVFHDRRDETSAQRRGLASIDHLALSSLGPHSRCSRCKRAVGSGQRAMKTFHAF
jgi:hypothetical protein